MDNLYIGTEDGISKHRHERMVCGEKMVEVWKQYGATNTRSEIV